MGKNLDNNQEEKKKTYLNNILEELDKKHNFEDIYVFDKSSGNYINISGEVKEKNKEVDSKINIEIYNTIDSLISRKDIETLKAEIHIDNKTKIISSNEKLNVSVEDTVNKIKDVVKGFKDIVIVYSEKELLELQKEYKEKNKENKKSMKEVKKEVDNYKKDKNVSKAKIKIEKKEKEKEI